MVGSNVILLPFLSKWPKIAQRGALEKEKVFINQELLLLFGETW